MICDSRQEYLYAMALNCNLYTSGDMYGIETIKKMNKTAVAHSGNQMRAAYTRTTESVDYISRSERKEVLKELWKEDKRHDLACLQLF